MANRIKGLKRDGDGDVVHMDKADGSSDILFDWSASGIGKIDQSDQAAHPDGFIERMTVLEQTETAPEKAPGWNRVSVQGAPGVVEPVHLDLDFRKLLKEMWIKEAEEYIEEAPSLEGDAIHNKPIKTLFDEPGAERTEEELWLRTTEYALESATGIVSRMVLHNIRDLCKEIEERQIHESLDCA